MSAISISHNTCPPEEASQERYLGLIPIARLDEFRIGPDEQEDVTSFCNAVDRHLAEATITIRSISRAGHLAVGTHTEIFDDQVVLVRSFLAGGGRKSNLDVALSILVLPQQEEIFGERHTFLARDQYVRTDSVRPLRLNERKHLGLVGKLLAAGEIQAIAADADLV